MKAQMQNASSPPPRKGKNAQVVCSVLDNLNEAFFMVNEQLQLVYINQEGSKALNKKKEDILGKIFIEVFPDSPGSPMLAAINKVIHEKIKVNDVFKCVMQDRWISMAVYPVGDTVAISFHDVHDLKEVKEQLKQKEEELRTLVENTPDTIARFDKELRYVFVNSSFTRHRNLPPEFFYGKTNLETGLPPDIAVPWMKKLRNVFDTGQPDEYSAFVQKADGSTMFMNTKIVPEFSSSGKVQSVLAIGRDLTKQKLAEEQLQQSESLLKEAQQLAHIGSWEKDLITGKTMCSDELFRIYGFEPGSTAPDQALFMENILHPSDKEIFTDFVEKLRKGSGPVKTVYRILRSSGEVRVIEAKGRTVFEGNTPVALRGTIQDVTELDHAQKELKENAHFIEQITHISPYLLAVTDLNEGRLIYVNKAVSNLFGYSSEEFRKMSSGTWMDLIHPEDKHLLKQLFANVVGSGNSHEAFYRVKRQDGVYRWICNRAAVFKRDRYGRPTQILSIAFDETDNMKAEISLRESKALLEAIFNSSTSGIEVYKAVRDSKGEIIDFECVLVNKATQKYLRREDLIGKRLVEEYPGVRSAGIFDWYKNVVDLNHILNVEHYYEDKGTGYWFHRAGVKMNDGLVVTWEDITEKKKMQEEHTRLMLKRQKEHAQAVFVAQEEERKRIAEALHNELGQLLYITKLKMADNMKQEADQLLEVAIEQVRNISFELMPTILHDFGLEIALKDLARKKLATQDIRYNLQMKGLSKRPSASVEEAVFRMLQELLNNVVKHANASFVNIEVTKTGKNIYLKVEDNGKGFTRQTNGKLKGFGMSSIENRIKLLNGNIEIESAPGEGTKVVITMPARASRTLWH